MADTGFIFPTIDSLDVALRLGVAALCGAVIGFERERRERAAGLRTHMLVSIGAAAFTIVSAYAWADYWAEFPFPPGTAPPAKDPSRIAAQIVSGIGFLGGGVILRSGLTVRGLTTAASIWAMGAVGMAAGAAMYDVAGGTTVIILLTLILLRGVNSRLRDRYRQDSVRMSVRITDDQALETIMELVEGKAAELGRIEIETDKADSDLQKVKLRARLNPGYTKIDLTRELTRLEHVVSVQLRDIDEL